MTEEEQNELLTAALELAGTVSKHVHCHDTAALVAAIEKHRPAPKLVEGWVNVGPDGEWGLLHRIKADATNRAPRTDRTVHVREVVEKRWNRWKSGEMCGEPVVAKSTGEYIGSCRSGRDADRIASAHNEQMEAIAK